MSHSTCNIRLATVDDAARLSVVAMATYVETYFRDVAGSDIVAWCGSHHSVQCYAELLNGGAQAWLAEAPHGAPIGYALVDRAKLANIKCQPTDCELWRLYVLAPFQKRGIGTDLMKASMTHCREQGFEQMLIQVLAANGAAMEFYKRFSASEIGTQSLTIGQNAYRTNILAIRLA